MNPEILLPVLGALVTNLIGWLTTRRRQTEAETEEQRTDVETRRLMNKAFAVLQDRNSVLERTVDDLRHALHEAEHMIEGLLTSKQELLDRIRKLESNQSVISEAVKTGDTGQLPALPA